LERGRRTLSPTRTRRKRAEGDRAVSSDWQVIGVTIPATAMIYLSTP